MKTRLTALILLIAVPITLFAANSFAVRAAQSFEILEQGYPDAIYFFAYYTDDAVQELIVKDASGTVQEGMVVLDKEDANLRIFLPATELALGDYTAEVKDQTSPRPVTIIERSADRAFTVFVKPVWQEQREELLYCEGERYETIRQIPGLDVTVTTDGPMKIESRLQKDGKTSDTQIWKIGGRHEARLVSTSATEAKDEMCAVLIATEIDSDAMIHTTTECVNAEAFSRRPLESTISDEIRDCADRERAANDGGCSSTGSNSKSWLVLFTLLGLFVSRRRCRNI